MGRVAIGLGSVMLAASVGLSFVHPWGNVRDTDQGGEILAGSSIPTNLRATIEAKCTDCHSNRTHWPVYSRLAPASWLIERDVYKGRSALNLSMWSRMSAEEQIAAVTRMVAEVRSGEMPPGSYASMHPATRLTSTEKQDIVAWGRSERKHLNSTTAKQTGAIEK
jgi:cytochrome c